MKIWVISTQLPPDGRDISTHRGFDFVLQAFFFLDRRWRAGACDRVCVRTAPAGWPEAAR